MEGARIHEVWPTVAGAAVAASVTPVRLAGGVLVLAAADAAWATQVRYLERSIVARANELLGPGAVRQVTVTLAGL